MESHMSRLQTIEVETAQGEAAELLGQAQKKLGGLPNFIKALANSAPGLAAYLDFSGHLGRGSLDAKTRERIALTTAEANGCQYCVSAHTAIAQKTGLTAEDIQAARKGASTDAKADAAVKFARSVHDNRGDVTKSELEELRAAGYGDGEVVEIIANVAANVFTNFFAKAAQVDIDFPEVELLSTAA